MKKVALCNDWRKYIVDCSEIELVKAEGRYSLVSINRENIFSDKSLRDWEKELNNISFFRVHKSYIVNLNYVRKVGDNILLESGVLIPLARRRKRFFNEQYKDYILG